MFVCTYQLFASPVTILPFKASFIQTVKNKHNKMIVYSGNIYTDRFKNVLWRYKKPTVKNIYLNKKNVIIEEPMLEQAIYTTLDSGVSIKRLLSKSKKIAKNRYRTTIKGITYYVTVKAKKPIDINYTDKFGNKVKISFSNIQSNPRYKAGFFKFKPKKGYDIIRK